MKRFRSRSPQPSEAGLVALGAAKMILAASRTAFEFSPLPGLGAAVDAVLTLITAVEKTKSNDEQLQILAAHIERLCNSIISPLHNASSKTKTGLKVPDSLKKRVKTLAETLCDASKENQKILSHGTLARFFLNEDVTDTLLRLNQQIKQALDEFLVEGMIELQLLAEKTHDAVVASAAANVRAMNALAGRVETVEVQIAESQQAAISAIQMSLITGLPHAEARYNAASRSAASSCLEGTRVALLEDIYRWIDDEATDKQRIFWLCGLAGTGKSTIAQTVAERLAKSNSLGATFFFSRDSADCSDALLVFSTIARQLALSNPIFGVQIGKALEAKRDAGKLVMKEQLQTLIIEPLRFIRNAPGQMVIVIDALDECRDWKLAQDILTLFAAEVQKLPFRMVLLITSRPELYITTKFDSPTLKSISRPFRLHQIEDSIVDADIELFLRTKLQDIVNTFSIEEPWPSDDAILRLRDRARELFIFAATVVKFIGNEVVDDPKAQLEIVLQEKTSADLSPYSEIDALYLRVLISSLPGEASRSKVLIERFQIVIGSIILLIDPLPLEALALLIGSSAEIIRSALKFLYSVIVLPTAPDEPIHTIHPSFHDFLVDRCTDERFLLKPSVHHERLAERCLHVMISLLKRNICNMEDTSMLNKEVYELDDRRTKCIPIHLRYACMHWGSHLSKLKFQSAQNSRLVTLFRDFVSQKLLQWLEALSILKSLNAALFALKSAEVWYSTISRDDQTSAVLRDAQRLVFEFFEPIKEGAGHVYHSALRFAPPCVLTKVYRSDTPPGLDIIHGRQNAWGAAIRSMHGHIEAISCVTCSPNGKLIASCSYDHTARVWDANTGTLLAILNGHNEPVVSAMFCSDSTRVLTASYDQTIRIWDSVSGANIQTLKGHIDSIYSAGFSQDGARVVSASRDRSVCVWDLATGESLAMLTGHYAFTAARFDPSSQFVITGDHGGYVCSWEWQESGTAEEIFRHGSDVANVWLSPDGSLIVSYSFDGTARVMTRSGEAVCTFNHSSPIGPNIIFALDGHSIWTFDKDIQLWDMDTGEQTVPFDLPTDDVQTFGLLPDQKYMVLGMSDGTVQIIDIDLAAQSSNIPLPEKHKDTVACLGTSFDGTMVASACVDNTVRVWDTYTGETKAVIPQPISGGDVPRRVCFNFDGSRVLSSVGSTLFVWDIAGDLQLTLQGHDQRRYITILAASPTQDRLVSGTDRNFRVWDLANARLVGEYKCQPTLARVAYAPDGSKFAVSHYLGTPANRAVAIWDTSTERVACIQHFYASRPKSIVWSSDGQLLACASNDGIIIWNVSSEDIVAVFKPETPEAMTTWLSFTPDSRGIISKAWDRADKRYCFNSLPSSAADSDTPDEFLLGHAGLDEEGWLSVFYPDGAFRRVCWIAEEHRPNARAYRVDIFDIQTRTLVIGGRSGSVLIIELSEDLLRLTSSWSIPLIRIT